MMRNSDQPGYNGLKQYPSDLLVPSSPFFDLLYIPSLKLLKNTILINFNISIKISI